MSCDAYIRPARGHVLRVTYGSNYGVIIVIKLYYWIFPPLPRSPSRPSCRVDSNKSALGLFAYHTGRRFRHPHDRVAGGRIFGEVSVSRTGCIQFAEGEAPEPKLGRLLCGSNSKVLVPLGGVILPIHLESGDLAFFDCAIGPCQGRRPSFGIRAASSAAARASSSAASFPLIPECPGTQRIITFPGPKLSHLTRWDQRRAASAKAVKVPWLDDVVVLMRERATSRLSRQMIRLSENSARTEPHASWSPFSAATASASKTSACGSGCLPREMMGCLGP